MQVSEKTVEISQLQAVEKIVETRETQMIQSIQTSESSDTAPVGAKTMDLEQVQVHPTGVVKPDDPDAKLKFLVKEVLHGVGEKRTSIQPHSEQSDL